MMADALLFFIWPFTGLDHMADVLRRIRAASTGLFFICYTSEVGGEGSLLSQVAGACMVS